MDHNIDLMRRFEDSDGVEAALYAIALALESVAYQIKYLGNGNASTQMGAIEAFSAHMGEKIDAASFVVAAAIERAT